LKAPFLFYSRDFLDHLTAGHPESPERLHHILQRLDQYNLLSKLRQVEPQKLSDTLLYRIHSPHYIQRFAQFSAQAGQGQRIDEDTVVSTGSYPAAQKAAGAAVDMVNALLSDQCDTAFALVRPPGHHAMPHYLMGFCFFNNIALAALHAVEQHQLTRVAIIDWDAHHGNGAEAIFYHDRRVFTLSWHQDPNWPGTGHMRDAGAGPGEGFNLNIPLPKGSGRQAFLDTFDSLVAPVLRDYAPQLILVAAGYDAHHADTLTEMGMRAGDFAELTAKIVGLAHEVGCKTGFLLEGGYHLEALSNSVTATLMTLIHQQASPFKESFLMSPEPSEPAVDSLVANIKAHHPAFQKLIQ
jgi:acetoin utilization deacetylase AcuC-like enzyme